MVSPELIRRYPFFAGLTYDHIVKLAELADEQTVEAGHYFFYEGDELDSFYLILDGAVGIILEVPDRDVEQDIVGQLTGKLKTKDVTTSTLRTGDVFGWSGLIPPHEATAGAKAIMPCRVLSVNCRELWQIFEADCRFGSAMILKGAQVIRERLRDMRIETLSNLVSEVL